MGKEKQKLVDELTKMYLEKINKNLDNAIDSTMKLLTEHIDCILRDSITRYYSYKTKMYVRYGQEKTYTGTGINLYKAIVVENLSDNKKLGIRAELDHSLLEPYINNRIALKYSWISGDSSVYEDTLPGAPTDVVLNMITSGNRFNVGKWNLGKVRSKYFKITAKTIDELFDQMSDQFSDVVVKEILRRTFK